MPSFKLDDNALRNVLKNTKVIAVVGHSDKPERTSHQIAKFLENMGYKVIPVNPMLTEIDGTICYPSLENVPESVDLVNIFRRSEYLPEIADSAISIKAKTIWAQLGIYDEFSAQKALSAGLNVIMDSCIKVEYKRLFV